MHLLLRAAASAWLMATLTNARIVDVFFNALKLPTFQRQWFGDETVVNAIQEFFPTEDMQQLTTTLFNKALGNDKKFGELLIDSGIIIIICIS